MTTSSRVAGGATRKSTASSPELLEFNGLEPLEFILTLPEAQRPLWVARRLEQYRDRSVMFASIVVRERGDKKTVAESEAQAVMETEGLTKVVPIESPLYTYLLGGDIGLAPGEEA